MRVYRGIITSLKPNEVFVFGSNTEGRHSLGSALIAREKFGAIYGQAEGLQGQSYAIITKDLRKKPYNVPSRSKEQIMYQIDKLYDFARNNPDKDFLVAYNGKGLNLNMYSAKEMAEMFYREDIPSNMIFEEEFYKLLEVNG
jgi:hypothetical protein